VRWAVSLSICEKQMAALLSRVRKWVGMIGARAGAGVSGSIVAERWMDRKGGVEMAIGECGVCGEWRSGNAFPSGNKRTDGTTPHDNFVCWRCQQEARELQTMDRAVNEYWKRRGGVRRVA